MFSKVKMIRVFLLFAIAIMMHVKISTAGASLLGDLETIFLRLYVGTTVEEYVDYSLNETDKLKSKLSADKPTVLYVHGYTESVEKKSVHTIVQAYLKRNDHNVLAMDYSILANKTYPIVILNAPRVAGALANTLDDMVKSGFDPEKLHVVGHSMGAQVSGFLGRKVSFRIRRITGLDPAGPGFNLRLRPKLSAKDAKFVDLIHTDWGHYGVARSTGTVDIFPNGGKRVQPGCPKTYSFFSKEEFCSHHRSWVFYSESIVDESAFVGVKCSSLNDFNSGKCKDNEQVIMGYATPSTARGKVYLTTAAQSPFGLKLKGTEPNPAS